MRHFCSIISRVLKFDVRSLQIAQCCQPDIVTLMNALHGLNRTSKSRILLQEVLKLLSVTSSTARQLLIPDIQYSEIVDGAQLLSQLIQRTFHPDFFASKEIAKQASEIAIQDCVAVLRCGRKAMLILLRTVHVWSSQLLQQQGSSDREGRSKRKRLFLLERKIYFLLVWANEQDQLVWQDLVEIFKPHLAEIDIDHTIRVPGIASNVGESVRSRQTPSIIEL